MTEFYGNRRGVVLNNRDPLKAGRVKVRVYGVYDDIPESDIPWAIFADPFMGGLSETGGTFLPEEGAHVWTFFDGGNHMLPVYWSGAPAMKDGVPDIPIESRDNYPNNRVIKTNAGHIIELDDSPGGLRVMIKHASGSFDSFVEGGSKVSSVEGDSTTTVNGDDTKAVNGSYAISGDTISVSAGGAEFSIDGSGNVNVSGTMINLN